MEEKETLEEKGGDGEKKETKKQEWNGGEKKQIRERHKKIFQFEYF